MDKPLLIIVTGRPAAGKTTLAKLLSRKINFPLLSRDELKEGLVNRLQLPHANLDKSADWHVYETFFETIDFFISRRISLLAEAAFQDKLWKPKLSNLFDKANIKIIICNADLDLIKHRFVNRLSNDPSRERYHGDQVNLADEQFGLLTENYKALNITAPTLQVDTTRSYNPTIEQIVGFIWQNLKDNS